MQRLMGEPARDEALRQIRRENPRDLLPALQLARALESHRVYLLSRLDAEMVEGLEMIPVESPSDICRLAERSRSCLVVANACGRLSAWKASTGQIANLPAVRQIGNLPHGATVGVVAESRQNKLPTNAANMPTHIAANVAEIRGRIAEAAIRSGRSADAVRLRQSRNTPGWTRFSP